jgi:DNA-directed RNA polymerase subunit M/transcription elongation factor TFIIS
MATAQTSKSTNDRNKKNQRSGSNDTKSATGERDENYNLISVLYHAQQAAETAQQYQQDAKRSGDEELAEFFEETRGGYVQFAEQAKQLLAARLDVDAEDEEEDEEEED